MYPHLTNLDGEWLITNLDKWTPTKNLYLPLRYRSLQALDDLIKNHLGDLATKKGCVIVGKNQHAFRSPYAPGPRTRPVFYVNYTKAILATRLEFSYHNWYDCLPAGSILSRICDSPGCFQPDHHIFGAKPRQGMVDLEQIKEITPEIEAWIELCQDTIPNLIREGRDVGDPDDKIIADVTRIATEHWNGKPIPQGECPIAEIVESAVHPTRITTTYIDARSLLKGYKKEE